MVRHALSPHLANTRTLFRQFSISRAYFRRRRRLPALFDLCKPQRLKSYHQPDLNPSTHPAPDPIQVGEHVIPQKSLYTGLFVIGIPLLWFSSPFSTVFWLIGASAVLILGHATIMEPGIESEYAQVQDSV